MKLRSIGVLALITLTFISCNSKKGNKSLVGKWKGVNSKDGFMVFYKDGKADILNENGVSAFDDKKNVKINYEVITEVSPHQIYLTISENDESQRIPLGIFKIQNGKLIIRDPIEYHRTMGGFDLGVSRYELPKDFNGILRVFIKEN